MLEIKILAELGSEEKEGILGRSQKEIQSVMGIVKGILDQVQVEGDEALLEMLRETEKDAHLEDLLVSEEEYREALREVDQGLIDALQRAYQNISAFHRAQMERSFWAVEVSEGMLLGRITRPIQRVGCYIPGGRAPYPSTVLMTVVPAKVAGVPEVYVTTPAGPGLKVNPAILCAARIAGATGVFKLGGPWGIGAFAYGTRSVPRVDKIVGPGNKYVTAAKLLVYGRVDIDSPAGPSEGLILADETANPKYVAWDFISQLEHDPDASAVLVTTSFELAERVRELLKDLIETQPKKGIILEALKNAHILFSEGLDDAISFVNEYAPEHLEIQVKEPFWVLNRIVNAGSIFLGSYAPIPLGDYASGTNHVLPTGGGARAFSGLSVDDFIKKPTFQYVTKEALAKISSSVVTLADTEGLKAHSMAVRVRNET